MLEETALANWATTTALWQLTFHLKFRTPNISSFFFLSFLIKIIFEHLNNFSTTLLQRYNSVHFEKNWTGWERTQHNKTKSVSCTLTHWLLLLLNHIEKHTKTMKMRKLSSAGIQTHDFLSSIFFIINRLFERKSPKLCHGKMFALMPKPVQICKTVLFKAKIFSKTVFSFKILGYSIEHSS